MEAEYTQQKTVTDAEAEHMCNILIETYNTSIIDYFDPSLKHALMEEALKCSSTNDISNGRKREVLASLIRNKQQLSKIDPSKVHFVGGPHNITYHWSTNYKKAVYIWGEIHDEKVDCPILPKVIKTTNIENFLLDHIENQIAFTDFFLEMPAYIIPHGYPEYGPNKRRLNILRILFKKCIGPERTAPENASSCNSSRMHFFDIRKGEVKGGTNSASLFEFDIQKFLIEYEYFNKDIDKHGDFVHNRLFLNIINNFVKRWNHFFEFFKNFSNNEPNTKLNHKKFWYDQIYNSTILKKEMDVMDDDVKPLLNRFIKKELDDLLDKGYEGVSTHSDNVLKVNYMIDNYLNIGSLAIRSTDIKSIKESINHIYIRGTLHFNCLIIDAYLLARIFKKFNIDSKPRTTDEPEKAHNIIIYAGNLHSQRYRKFLKYLGFRQVESAGDLEKPQLHMRNCVLLSGITQPFFSKYPYGEKDDEVNSDYSGLQDEFNSFNSVFHFDTKTIPEFSIFEEPVVPTDLLEYVSVNHLKKQKIEDTNPIDPSESTRARNFYAVDKAVKEETIRRVNVLRKDVMEIINRLRQSAGDQVITQSSALDVASRLGYKINITAKFLSPSDDFVLDVITLSDDLIKPYFGKYKTSPNTSVSVEIEAP